MLPRCPYELASTIDKVLQARNNDGCGGTLVWGTYSSHNMLKSRREVWRSLQHVRSSAQLCCACSLPALHFVLLIYPPVAFTASLNYSLGLRIEIGEYFVMTFSVVVFEQNKEN